MTDLQQAALSILNGLLSNPERCRDCSPMDMVDEAHLIAELFVPYEGYLEKYREDRNSVSATCIHRDRMWNPRTDKEAKCGVFGCSYYSHRYSNRCEKYECINDCGEKDPKGYRKSYPDAEEKKD